MRLLPQGRSNISVKDYSAKYLEAYQDWGSALLMSIFLLIPCPIGFLWQLARAMDIPFEFSYGIFLSVLYYFFVGFLLSLVDDHFQPLEHVPVVEEALLVGMLKALRERNSSAPKDKAFGLEGVLQALNVAPDEATKVDSVKSLGQVYYELFRDLLLWNPRLICLILDVGPQIPHAPSWVPDWSTLHQRSWIKHDIIYESVTSNTGAPEVEICGGQLLVQGTILGAASYVTGPFNRLDGDNLETNHNETRQDLAAAISQFSGWLEVISRDVPVSPIYESLPKAILDALYGRLSSFDRANEPDYNKWRRTLSQWDVRGNEAPTNDLFDRVADDPSALEFTVKICNTLFQKRGLFFSLDGHIGSGPPNTLVGDKIAVLNGVSRPLILREDAQRLGLHRVIGPAFVCGFTDFNNEVHQGQDWSSLTLI